MDNQSIHHTRWNCTYHIVFIPKYRKKIMYGSNKKDLVEIIKKALRNERRSTHRRENMCRPYSHVHSNSTQDERFGVHVVSQGKECPHVFRQASREQDEMGRPASVGTRLLCSDSRKCE